MPLPNFLTPGKLLSQSGLLFAHPDNEGGSHSEDDTGVCDVLNPGPGCRYSVKQWLLLCLMKNEGELLHTLRHV
jgi:hypothetical protein